MLAFPISAGERKEGKKHFPRPHIVVYDGDVRVFSFSAEDQMEIEELYLSKERFRSPTIVTFLNTGYAIDGAFGKEYVFSVGTGTAEGNISLWKKHVQPLVKAWGRNTASWVGRRCILHAVPVKTKEGKEVLSWSISVPIDEKKPETVTV